MKSFIKEYLEVAMYTICGILIIIGSYNIIINIHHSNYLNEKIVVREIDYNYQEYKKNVLKLESLLSKTNSRTKLYYALNNALEVLKEKGAYRLLPGDILGYNDVYNLNDYFLDKVINESWVSSIKNFDLETLDNDYVNVLINNANYVNKELLNNSNFHYDVKNNDIRNSLGEEYSLVLSNYKNYSLLLINLCERLGDNNA